MKMYICAIKTVTKGMKPIKMMRLNAVSTIASQKVRANYLIVLTEFKLFFFPTKIKQTINECTDDF